MDEQPQDPLLGWVLDGRYQVISQLGRGGMGTVYLAEDTRLRRKCALKVLHPGLTAERAHIERFLREAQTIAQFEHPNIVDIFAYGEEPNGVVFFAMELLTGEDLDARVKRSADQPYTPQEACVWAIQVARAVAVVHDTGLIHRDLKVSNVFLARRRDGEEVVKLLDFGIARSEEGSELTVTGVAIGTPSYMSPEQIESRGVDRRTDIYSFGVLLFKLLTGRLPFVGDAFQVAIHHHETPPPSPSRAAPEAGISSALEQIVLTALAKSPGDRFQSMQAVEAALIAVLAIEAPDLLVGLVRAPRPTTAGNHASKRPAAAAPSTEATPAANVHSTGPTSAMAARAPRGNRMLFWLTSGSVLAVGVLAAVLMQGGKAPEMPVSADDAGSGVRPSPPTTVRPEPATSDPAPSTVVELPLTPSPAPDPETVTMPSTPAIDVTGWNPGVPPAGVKPLDPGKRIALKAARCRRIHKAVGGAKITISFWVTNTGQVREVMASESGKLGECLAQAVAEVKFAKTLALDQKLEL